MLMNAYPNKLYQLKHRNSCLGLIHYQKPYVISFISKMDVYKIKDNLSIEYRSYLLKNNPENINKQVNEGLLNLNVNLDLPDIISDTNATLHIHKRNIRAEKLPITKVDTVDFSEVLLYPFYKNLGIVIAKEIIEETDEQYVLLSDMIESCDIASIFSKELHI
jgi:hypothetical protein